MRTCRTSAVGGLKLSFLPIWVVIGAILFGIGRSRRVVPGPGSGKSCNRFSRVLAYGVAMAFGTIDSASKVAKAADWPALAVFTPRTGGGAQGLHLVKPPRHVAPDGAHASNATVLIREGNYGEIHGDAHLVLAKGGHRQKSPAPQRVTPVRIVPAKRCQ